MHKAFIAFPQFEILRIEKTDIAIKYSGIIKNVVSLSRVEPGWIVTICVNENKFIKGRFLEINSQHLQASIDVSDLDSVEFLAVGKVYALLDGYWGDLAELVLHHSIVWQKLKFEPRDSTVYHPDGTVEPVKGGWGHEHCRICWQNISQFEVDNQYGYVNQNDDWLCESCYQKYVLKKSLGFININQMF